MMKSKFRFQDLQIWQHSIDVSNELLDLADSVEARKHYRFAEQLRGAVMSISNNIAEGSGSYSKKDFANFLNIARRSTFEVANILIIFYKRQYIDQQLLDKVLEQLDIISRKISNFRKTLLA